MPHGRIPPGGKAPFCADCKTTDCHVVTLDSGAIVWLCGSCEILRTDPEAARLTNPPGLPSTWPKGRGKPQKERLF